MADTTCLYSVVKNISGATQFFPFLGNHGIELADDAEYSQYGDIREQVSHKFGGFGRQQLALEAALLAEVLTIVSTPAPILFDATDDVSVQLVVDNDTLGTTTACWVVTTTTTTEEPTTTGG